MGGVSAKWCECEDGPVSATGPLTMLAHDESCGFPERRCENDQHRITIHDACGKPVRMRYCTCTASGYTHDVARDWWVHYACGWPTKAWYAGSDKPAPPKLAGIKPVTYHEYVPVTGKANTDRLSNEAKKRNKAAIGSWVWD